MSVVDVAKMWSRSGGSVTSATARLSDSDVQWQAGYSVLTNDPADDVDVVTFAPGVPNIGDPFPTQFGAIAAGDFRVVGKSAERLGPVYWIVTVSYSGGPPSEKPDIEWSSVETTEPIDEDINGKAIVNVNGEPVDGLTTEVCDAILVVSRRFELFNPDLFLAYLQSVNSDDFAQRAPGTLRFRSFAAKNNFAGSDDPVGHWRVKATFQYRQAYRTTVDKAWWKRYRNEGLYARLSSTGPIVRAVDSNNQPVTNPVLLKANGTREPDPEAAVWLEAQVLQPLPYNALGFL
jgi:hypothetical protein